MDFRPAIRSTLWACSATLGVSIVAAGLWLVLSELGDEAGGQGAKGVLLVALVCFAIGLATLVVLLALAELARPRVLRHDAPRDISHDRARDQISDADSGPTAV